MIVTIKYTNYKNKLSKTIRLAEKQYNSDKFLQTKGNMNPLVAVG